MKNKPPKRVRREQNRRVEMAKRAMAHSKPLFNPNDAWAPKKKVGGVPVLTLEYKQHQVVHEPYVKMLSWW